MSSVAFILGAGASREAGAPLMDDFLDVAYRMLRVGNLGDATESFVLVFRAISELHGVLAKADIDIKNLESVFQCFEMATTLGRLGVLSGDLISVLVPAMKIVIATTIERSIVFPYYEKERQLGLARPYDGFANLLHRICTQSEPKGSVSVITFNYDVALDLALSAPVFKLDVDYGLRPRQQRSSVPILKLHGSLNWWMCTRCGEVDAAPVRSEWAKALDAKRMDRMIVPASLYAVEGGRCSNCPMGDSYDVAIVPPSFSKTEHHRRLANVWNAAAQELSEAEQIFVVGYSLPESDAFFRYLYGLGTLGRRTLRRFMLCDPDPSGKVAERFQRLLGSSARQRFEFVREDFSRAIPVMTRAFFRD